MTLLSLDVEGLRGFGRGPRRGRLHLAPVTLVYGENSSGKSTLVRALALLAQLQRENRGTEEPVDWVAHGPWFSLGQAWDALHEGADWLAIRLRLSAVDRSAGALRWEHEVDWRVRWGGAERLSLDSVEAGWTSEAGRVRQRFDVPGGPGPMPMSEHATATAPPDRFERAEVQELLRLRQQEEDLRRIAGDVTGLPMSTTPWPELLAALWSADERFREELLADEPEQLAVDLAPSLGLGEGEDDERRDGLLRRATAAVSLARALDEATATGDDWSPLGALTWLGPGVPAGPALSGRPTLAGALEWREQAETRRLRNWLAHAGDATSGARQLRDRTARLSRANEANADLLRAAGELVQEFHEHLDYVPAHRLTPARAYPALPESGEPRGSHVVRSLHRDRTLLAKASAALGHLFGTSLTVTPLLSTAAGTPRPSGMLELRVSEPDGSSRSIADVGLGVSQVLPMLAAASSRGCAVIEEPESNLHPTAQARLIQALIEAAEVTSATPPSAGPRLVLETHSEHILQRVLQLIEDGALTDEQVAINYVSREGGLSRSRRVRTRGGRLIDPLLPPERDDGDQNPTLSMI